MIALRRFAACSRKELSLFVWGLPMNVLQSVIECNKIRKDSAAPTQLFSVTKAVSQEQFLSQVEDMPC